MQIVYQKAVADQLKDKYTVLELETFDVDMEDGTTQKLEAYCVVPSDKIPLVEMASLDAYKTLHAEFVNAYNSKNYQICKDLAEHLTGKFGGELDSFYEVIIDRINNESTNS